VRWSELEGESVAWIDQCCFCVTELEMLLRNVHYDLSPTTTYETSTASLCIFSFSSRATVSSADVTMSFQEIKTSDNVLTCDDGISEP
jgi:hypothetical protein